jgi:hypothetical protein
MAVNKFGQLMQLLRREPNDKAPGLPVIPLFLIADASIGKNLQVLSVYLFQQRPFDFIVRNQYGRRSVLGGGKERQQKYRCKKLEAHKQKFTSGDGNGIQASWVFVAIKKAGDLPPALRLRVEVTERCRRDPDRVEPSAETGLRCSVTTDQE